MACTAGTTYDSSDCLMALPKACGPVTMSVLSPGARYNDACMESASLSNLKLEARAHILEL